MNWSEIVVLAQQATFDEKIMVYDRNLNHPVALMPTKRDSYSIMDHLSYESHSAKAEAWAIQSPSPLIDIRPSRNTQSNLLPLIRAIYKLYAPRSPCQLLPAQPACGPRLQLPSSTPIKKLDSPIIRASSDKIPLDIEPYRYAIQIPISITLKVKIRLRWRTGLGGVRRGQEAQIVRAELVPDTCYHDHAFVSCSHVCDGAGVLQATAGAC